MNILQKIFFITMVIFIGSANAANTTINTQASATLATSCTISSSSVSFGALILPLSPQSATGNIDVLCNKSSSYSINLAYGGIYGVGQTTEVVQNLTVYFSGGLGYVSNGVAADYYFNICGGCAPPNYTKTGTTTSSSILNGFCNPYCEVWTSTYSTTTVTRGTNYSYGKMSGIKGDNVAYSIVLPNDSSKIWNTGNYKFTDVGTGVIQSIPVKAKLVPAQSGRAYPTPDLYSDTVTATMTF